MPQWPHEYSLRRNWLDDSEFVQVVLFIRANGYDDYFRGRPYKAIDINGWKYWTMDEPTMDECNLINRNRFVFGTSPYGQQK
jgi:hypothetical protein